jgi:hypothetical protein
MSDVLPTPIFGVSANEFQGDELKLFVAEKVSRQFTDLIPGRLRTVSLQE